MHFRSRWRSSQYLQAQIGPLVIPDSNEMPVSSGFKPTSSVTHINANIRLQAYLESSKELVDFQASVGILDYADPK